MTDIVKRLLLIGERVSIPCPDDKKGCLVYHYRIETDPTCKEAADLMEELITALRACHASLNVAFDYDGDVFGIHHNAAVDADIMVKQVLEKVDWRITDDDR